MLNNVKYQWTSADLNSPLVTAYLEKNMLYISSYHKIKPVSHWIIDVSGQLSLEILIWPCQSVQFRKNQIFYKTEPQQALQSLFCTGRGLGVITQGNRHAIERIEIMLCFRLQPPDRGDIPTWSMQMIMWTSKSGHSAASYLWCFNMLYF